RELPMLNRVPESNVVKGNPNRMRAEIIAGLAEAYGDQLDAAQARFESLLAEAPGNSDLRHELANVYRWRGWLDRALDEYRQVLATEDELLSAELGYTRTQIDARDYAAAAMNVSLLTGRAGHEPATQRLADDWRVHNRSQLLVTASSGDSTGPVFGADYHAIDARWYTAPIRHRYRGFVRTHDGFAEYPEGESRRRRLGAGIEVRMPRYVATGEISADRGGGDLGLAASLDWRVGDYWSLAAAAAHNGDGVQLRAHRRAIETDSLRVGARYAWNESASVGFGASFDDYSDSNLQRSLFADAGYRVLNRPRQKLALEGSVATTRSSLPSAPYFSPRRGTTMIAGLRHDWRLHRRYERELVQSVFARTGRYAQSGFDAGSIWSAGYRIDWRINNRFSVGIAAERHGQRFDGVRERTTVGIVDFNGRF
ncbi:MAG: hypothetical protein R3305_11345, partial [Gammaproteobacteria bacterium]|nr:hypothetical protein [Gammaproteobacteria bacterium]